MFIWSCLVGKNCDVLLSTDKGHFIPKYFFCIDCSPFYKFVLVCKFINIIFETSFFFFSSSVQISRDLLFGPIFNWYFNLKKNEKSLLNHFSFRKWKLRCLLRFGYPSISRLKDFDLISSTLFFVLLCSSIPRIFNSN